jgi:hypothetical protein
VAEDLGVLERRDPDLLRGDCTPLSLALWGSVNCRADLTPPADCGFKELPFLCLSSGFDFGGGGFARVATRGNGELCFLLFFTSPGASERAVDAEPGDEIGVVFFLFAVCVLVLIELDEPALVGRTPEGPLPFWSAALDFGAAEPTAAAAIK